MCIFPLDINPGMVLLGHKLCICSALIDPISFQSSCSDLFFQKQNMRVWVPLCPYQELVLSVFSNFSNCGIWIRESYHSSLKTIKSSAFSRVGGPVGYPTLSSASSLLLSVFILFVWNEFLYFFHIKSLSYMLQMLSPKLRCSFHFVMGFWKTSVLNFNVIWLILYD